MWTKTLETFHTILPQLRSASYDQNPKNCISPTSHCDNSLLLIQMMLKVCFGGLKPLPSYCSPSGGTARWTHVVAWLAYRTLLFLYSWHIEILFMPSNSGQTRTISSATILLYHLHSFTLKITCTLSSVIHRLSYGTGIEVLQASNASTYVRESLTYSISGHF